MAHMVSCALRLSTFTLCLAALGPATAFPQTSSDISSAATPSAGVAYVYVGTTKGVYLYNSASNGSLSLVSGSPFSVAGNAVGSNGKYFVSLGTAYLHSYPVASNGAIQGQVSQINTQSYLRGDCGTTYGGLFDHTGQAVYVQRNSQAAGCTVLQSFKISSTGGLTFLGSTEFNQTIASTPTLITLTGYGGHGFSFAPVGSCTIATYEFGRGSGGLMGFEPGSNQTDPTAQPGWAYQPLLPPSGDAADPTDHLAIAVMAMNGGPCGPVDRAQLASYTAISNGDFDSSNTWENMPTPLVYPTVLNMSPLGQLLAVGGNTTFSASNGTQTPGLQVFHFNGENPITSYSGVLTTAPIDEIHWDNNNHLYALSNSTKKLYAYTVTSSSITAVPGSPYTIASTPNTLAVVPTSPVCSAPASVGVHICAPTSGSTVSSPVLVEASSTVTGTIARMELWVDGVKKYTATSSKQLNTTLGMVAGSHRFAVLAINTGGQSWQSAVSATVK
jgi:hypothetical protein